jgi:hypothetical protein
VGVDVDGVRTAWHNLLSLTCTGWRCTAGASGFPADVLKLAQCTVSAGAFDPGGCTDLRSVYRRDAYKAGTGLTRTGGVFAINPVVVATTGAVTVGFSATPSFNFSSGNLQAITLAGNVTASSILNPVPAQSITFKICQDSTGGWTFQWPSNSAGGMTVGTAPGKCSVQSFVYDGIKWIATSTGASNL